MLLAAVQAPIEGEYLETLMKSGADVSEDRAAAVAADKTGALLTCACESARAQKPVMTRGNAGCVTAGH
ncbi:hypothetical protein [Streptomyces coeruleorubidus]|uniref:hypothetical protein n=1 Tax=Streptomyces coeruleorubidus TaxID=116188 RepID=UPI0036798F64